MTLPTLATERFRLRPLAAQDEALYVAIYTDDALMRHVGEPMTASDARRAFDAFLRSNAHADLRRACCWVIECGGNDSEVVGLLALSPHSGAAEIGVMVLAPWQGRKVAQETIAFLSGHLFEEGAWPRTFSRHARDNDAGAGVMRRLGFHAMAEVPGGSAFRGWEMTRDEWMRRFAAQAGAGQ